MAKGKTISLRGAAAQAFVEVSSGRPAKSPEQECERVATLIHMYVADRQMPKAVEILKAFKEAK